MADRVVLATRNAGKIAELRRILAEAGFGGELAGLEEFPGAPDVAETGSTFADNALLKARAIAAFTGLPAVSDDSGLTVNALNGMPGILSARWAGKHGDDRANLELLLGQLSDIENRGAAFVCVAALALPGPPKSASAEPDPAEPDPAEPDPAESGQAEAGQAESGQAEAGQAEADQAESGGREWTVTGVLPGSITRESRGTNGFGYDPIFVPEGSETTTAQLTPAEKDAISHRGRAFRALAPLIAANCQPPNPHSVDRWPPPGVASDPA